MTETRRDKRAALALEVRFKSSTLDEFVQHYSHDVSRGGIFIKSKQPLAVGTLIKFEFQLADKSKIIYGVGRIAWTRDASQATPSSPAGIGVKFIKMDADSRALVQQIVDRRGGAKGAFDDVDEGTDVGVPFFPDLAPAELPPLEDRTNVRHAGQFLADALSEAGAATAAEAAKSAEDARRRAEALAATRAAEAQRLQERERERLVNGLVRGARPEPFRPDPDDSDDESPTDSLSRDALSQNLAKMLASPDVTAEVSGEELDSMPPDGPTIAGAVDPKILEFAARSRREQAENGDEFDEAPTKIANHNDVAGLIDAVLHEEPTRAGVAISSDASMTAPKSVRPPIDQTDKIRVANAGSPESAQTKTEPESSKKGLVLAALVLLGAGVGGAWWLGQDTAPTVASPETIDHAAAIEEPQLAPPVEEVPPIAEVLPTEGALVEPAAGELPPPVEEALVEEALVEEALVEEALVEEAVPEPPVEVPVEVPAAATAGTVAVTTSVPASIWVGDVEVGSTTAGAVLSVDAANGARIVARSPGYLDAVGTASGGPLLLTLEPMPFVLEVVTNPPGAQVMAGGRTITTPGEFRFPRWPGDVTIVASLPGYSTAPAVIQRASFRARGGLMRYQARLTMVQRAAPAAPAAPAPALLEP